MRTRRDGARWSRWVPLDAGSEDAPDPGSREDRRRGFSTALWVGQADRVQYRASRPLPGVRLHFVNTTGTATRLMRARTALRRLANGAVAGIARIASARADSDEPQIVSRAEWGAGSCRPARRPAYGSVSVAFVHHTVSRNEYSRSEAPAMVLAICRYHRNSNGWDDIGYNFLVDRYGTVYEGRAGGTRQAVVGAQTAGYNSRSTGIANLGTFTDTRQSAEAVRSLAQVIAWKLSVHGIPVEGRVNVASSSGSVRGFDRISGHRDANATACPGNALYAQLAEVRRQARDGAQIATGPRIALAASPRIVRHGRRVRLSGRLTAPGGGPLAGQRVRIQAHKRGRWVTVESLTSGEDGSFEVRLRPPERRLVRARYIGPRAIGSGSSRTLALGVRPRLGARLVTPRVRTGGSAVVRGGVRPRKRVVVVIVHRRAGSRYKRVATLHIRTVGRRFRGIFHPRRRGHYHLQAVSPTDEQTLSARTPTMHLSVRGGSGGTRSR